MPLPWTLTFLREYGPHVSWRSLRPLRNAILANTAGQVDKDETITVRLRQTSTAITLRPGSHDLCTFDELFREHVYAAAVRAAQPIRTMIDLGGNIGLASLYVLGRSPSAQIVALEPDDDNYRLLNDNLKPYSQVRVWRAAVAAKDGPVRFLAAPNHVSAGALTRIDDPQGRIVDGLSMATILERSGFASVDLLKIDVEGGEKELFGEPLDWLARVRVLAIEFHDNTRKASNFDSVMTKANFQIHDGDHTVVAVRR